MRTLSYEPKASPIPFGDSEEQKEFMELLKQHERKVQVDVEQGLKHPDYVEQKAEFEGERNPVTGEIGGPKGKEPTRYGDWERNGRVYDF
jgi:hypothetical protein